MNLNINEPKVVVSDNLDLKWKDKTIYNHYDNPTDFMDDILNNSNLYENKELKYDFIVINKRLLMSNFPIKTKYKIAGSIDYKKILDMSLSIIKKNKNSNIFGVNNILISKFKDSDNNIEILISPNNLFDENKKQLIKEYIKECFKIYSAESISKNKEDFYKIRSDILESLNKLILKISLDQEIGKKTNKNKNKKGKI